MADSDDSSPDTLSGGPSDLDPAILREHFRDITRWAIRDAVGDQLPAGRSDALADELAVILASGLAPALHREIEAQVTKALDDLQNGVPLSEHAEEISRGAVFRLPARWPYEETVEFLFADTPPGAERRMGLLVTTGYKAGSWARLLPDEAFVPARPWTLSASWLCENWRDEVYAGAGPEKILVCASYSSSQQLRPLRRPRPA